MQKDTRILEIDGFRGLCLLLVAYTHVQYVVDSTLGRINYNALMWVDPAAGFVVISGFVVGLIGTRVALRHGMSGGFRFLGKRLRILTFWHVASVIFTVAMISIAKEGADMGMLGARPVIAPLLAATFLLPQDYFNVLVMYFWFLCLAFPALWICLRHSPSVLIALSVAAWCLTQNSTFASIFDYEMEQLVAALFGGEWLRASFSFYGWQLMFLVPFALGSMTQLGENPFGFLNTRTGKHLFYASAFFIGFMLLTRLALPLFTERGTTLWKLFQGPFDKRQVAPAFLVGVLSYGMFFTWLLSCGQSQPSNVMRQSARWLSDILTSRLLVLVGQASIQVFATNTMFVFLVKSQVVVPLPEAVSFGILVASAMLAVGVAALTKGWRSSGWRLLAPAWLGRGHGSRGFDLGRG
ncbi:OpgC domain-containing protein [Litoreibacter roseus]|uniref:Uncharacterized protein n=1 Tax=Litoreibacter roseus TaxID=2601869 RepID=A0A6N6JHZ7_9RHOB|nr:OpgC domain-containing protein [Litoreibacter roseus]GFE65961.1 hypothetical protein KIN_30350 [Litoreibacter roseus]